MKATLMEYRTYVMFVTVFKSGIKKKLAGSLCQLIDETGF